MMCVKQVIFVQYMVYQGKKNYGYRLWKQTYNNINVINMHLSNRYNNLQKKNYQRAASPQLREQILISMQFNK